LSSRPAHSPGSEVELASPGGAIGYEDTLDHFENGLLRLLNLDRAEFERWLALAEEADGNLLERLARGWERLRPFSLPAEVPAAGAIDEGSTGVPGELLHASIVESPGHGIAHAPSEAIGWLVRWDGRRFVRELSPPDYEEEYFQGDKRSAGGYGDYAEQAGWRLEKAHRQVREMCDATGLGSGRVLDVGCGYGFFRLALREAGFDQDGLEVSAFARQVAAETYGLETFDGVLEDHWRSWGERYDAVTAFDLIEHLADGAEFLRQVAHCLRDGGFVGLKTPNLDCSEADVFGPHYHSLKREHLLYFTPRSLTAAAERAGLEPAHVTTASHLLGGFFGGDALRQWERDARGADVVAWYRKRD
jgi:2-polyprenyl-3-methyl-5-hydroxy-6-metoxy-1,4-benzoquinol methylase